MAPDVLLLDLVHCFFGEIRFLGGTTFEAKECRESGSGKT